MHHIRYDLRRRRQGGGQLDRQALAQSSFYKAKARAAVLFQRALLGFGQLLEML